MPLRQATVNRSRVISRISYCEDCGGGLFCLPGRRGDRAAEAAPGRLCRIATMLSIFVVGMPHVMPLVYLLVGYWLPALIVREPNVRFEQRLLDIDRRLFGPDGLASFERSAPRPVIEYLELAYLLCYAVVPAGYACLLLAGQRRRADRSILVDRAAGLVPVLRTAALDTDARAPCHRAGSRRRALVDQAIELAVLNRASVQWNTFPSGHTAASVATALAVGGRHAAGRPGAGCDRGQHRRRQRGRPLSLRGRRACGSCGGGGRVRYGNRRARTVTDGRFTVTSRLFGGTSLDGRAYTTWY